MQILGGIDPVCWNATFLFRKRRHEQSHLMTCSKHVRPDDFAHRVGAFASAVRHSVARVAVLRSGAWRPRTVIHLKRKHSERPHRVMDERTPLAASTANAKYKKREITKVLTVVKLQSILTRHKNAFWSDCVIHQNHHNFGQTVHVSARNTYVARQQFENFFKTVEKILDDILPGRNLEFHKIVFFLCGDQFSVSQPGCHLQYSGCTEVIRFSIHHWKINFQNVIKL